ncbi:replication initiation protein [Flexibacterium corallicola]|uniref:replication initiation protein n=1 Tax=Flexibacterium corallicola TaxID=3037259 RepID=UPI00286EC63F|nr:replication initiation protein [Pseudovibrio sp. M1P-2-3]
MGKTIQVASDREYDDTKTVLPAEYVRGLYIKNAPSLRAIKLMHLMIATAGGRMADDVRHDIRVADINAIEGMAHHTKETLKPLFEELRAAVLTYDDPEAMKYTIGGFLDQAVVDYRQEETGDILVSWFFGRMFRDMASKSDHWAILDRQTVFHLGSKYSVLLFQHIASLTGLEHIKSKSFTIPELRAVLGIPEGKLSRFSNLNQRTLQPAIEEINQLSRFNLKVVPKKIGRSVVTVEIAWSLKQNKEATKKELSNHSTGRKARRTGTVEQAVEQRTPFPETGTISFSEPWKTIARAHGNGKDIDLIATDFRNWCASGGIPLDKKGIEKTFMGFCKKVRIN